MFYKSNKKVDHTNCDLKQKRTASPNTTKNAVYWSTISYSAFVLSVKWATALINVS